jgi:hypothetical protein
MSLRKPLVLVSGQVQQLQSGDTLDAVINNALGEVFTNGEVSTAITAGMAVYLFSADSVKRAEANAAGTARAIALCKDASIAAGSSGEFYVWGELSLTDWTAVVGATTLTAGSVYYLDPATPGKLTATAPSTVGQLVVEVGLAVDTATLLIDIKSPVLL